MQVRPQQEACAQGTLTVHISRLSYLKDMLPTMTTAAVAIQSSVVVGRYGEESNQRQGQQALTLRTVGGRLDTSTPYTYTSDVADDSQGLGPGDPRT